MTEDLFKEISEWQRATFPDSTASSKLYHLLEEIDEVITAEDDTNLLEEFADCFLLLYGAANACGIDYQTIVKAISDKLEINKKRKWGTPDENGVVNHIQNGS